MTAPPIKRVVEAEIQQRFNEGRYWDKTKTGELSEVVMEDRHPSLTVANEPFCTRSQMVSYRDPKGNEVARVHQYLRTDGTVGASGKPDPKRLYDGGILYRIVKAHNRESATKGPAGVPGPAVDPSDTPDG